MRRTRLFLAAVVAFPAFVAFRQPRTSTQDATPDAFPVLSVGRECDPQFVSAARRAWIQSGLGTDHTEAGFWVYEVNEDTRYLDLPHTDERGEMTIKSIPPNAIAIFHTHPNNSSPQPSPNDVAAADRLKLTVYTGSSEGLWAHDPGSVSSYVVRPGLTWTKPCKG